MAAALLSLCLSAACHPASETREPVDVLIPGAQANAPAVATIVVRGLEDGWTLRARQQVHFSNGGELGSLEFPAHEGRWAQDHVSIECPLDSVCGVGLEHTDGTSHRFVVVTGAPIIEIEIPELPETHEIRPLYVQPQSRSARIAALFAEEAALLQACNAAPEGGCGRAPLLPDPHRVVPGHDPYEAMARLRATLTREDEALATWAYFNVGCQQSPMDAELARQALREPIDPLARNLWPFGVARAILAAEGRAGAESRLAAMRAPGDRELAAATLIELVNEARDQQDLARAIALHEALQSGEGPWQGSPLRTLMFAQRSVIGMVAGSIPLRTLAGELHDPADMVGKPILLYNAASWCKACHREGLPELRSLAAKHPELPVLYILWDEAETAAAYIAKHTPIPGTIVLPDDEARAKLTVLMGGAVFPSFLVIDGEGRVAAIPGGDDLDTAVQRSGVLAAR